MSPVYQMSTTDVPMTMKPGYSLDPLTVFWRNWGEGRGEVTIIHYGSAWTAYFGAMGSTRTIKEFFLEASTEYLVNKLTSDLHKKSKQNTMLLTRIVEAVKACLKQP